MKKRKIFTTLLFAFMLLLTACGGNGTGSGTENENQGENEEETALPTEDRAGNPLEVPENIETIVSLAPAITQTLEDLGVADNIVAIDNQTPNFVEGLEDLPQVDALNLDMEKLIALEPDMVFAAEISFGQDEDVFQPLLDAGIPVARIPTATTIADIQEDTQFIADVLSLSTEGERLNTQMQEQMDEIAEIGETITDSKTVLFEISPLPDIFSTGSGTFLNEMIELVGAENIFADQESWLPVSEEVAVDANPDVIITNVSFIPDPVNEIFNRPGWENVTAIQNEAVFQVDNGLTSLPNNRIVEGLREIALAIYPEQFADLETN